MNRADIAGTVYHWCIIHGWGIDFAEKQKARVLADTGDLGEWISDLILDVKKGQNDRWN